MAQLEICEASKAMRIGKWLKSNKVCLVGLLETRVKGHNIARVAHFISKSWRWDSNKQFHNRVRILLGWNHDKLEILVVKPYLQFMHCKVTIRHSRISFWFTMVYGLNSISGKKELWKELVDIGPSMVDPWCV